MIGAKRNKVWVEHEKPDKNPHISTVNTAVLPSLSDPTSLSRTPVYFRIKQPSIIRVIIFMLPIKIHRKYKQSALETNIFLMSHHIFADLNVKTQQEVIEFFPFIARKFILKPVSVWLCSPRQQK